MQKYVGDEEWAQVNAQLPVTSLEDFRKLNAELEADTDFERLLVGKVSLNGNHFVFITEGGDGA